MQAINRSLLALALCGIAAAPAFAQLKLSTPAMPVTPTVSAPPAKPVTQASDAVSTRATARESGRVMESPVKAGTTVDTKARANPGKGNWWADADIDGDGQLSAAEAKAQAGLDARFSSVDVNGDGYVTSEEYRNFFTGEKSQGELHAAANSAVVTRDVWGKLDANSDGKLSSSEVSSNSTVSGAFPAMDSNGDGFVTQAEYRSYAQAHLKK